MRTISGNFVQLFLLVTTGRKLTFIHWHRVDESQYNAQIYYYLAHNVSSAEPENPWKKGIRNEISEHLIFLRTKLSDSSYG